MLEKMTPAQFVEEMAQAIGEPPQFNVREEPLAQFYKWIKWSGERDLLCKIKRIHGIDESKSTSTVSHRFMGTGTLTGARK